MAGPGHGPGGRPPRGMKPQVKNPGKLFMRLMRYVFRKYKWHYLTVIALIFVGVLASVQGTMFQKTLIDDYIAPLLVAETPDFGPLAFAILTNSVLLIPLVGGIYFAEAISVILQVASFKLTGKRIFKMAPIHHHFEQCGWPETRVVFTFWIITVVLAWIGIVAIF